MEDPSLSFAKKVVEKVDELESKKNVSPSLTGEGDRIVYSDVNIKVRMRDGGMKAVVLSNMVLPEKPTMEDFRKALRESPLRAPEYDVFLENWSRIFYVSKRDIYFKYRRLTSSAILQRILRDEVADPGAITFVVEQCRSAKWSCGPLPGKPHSPARKVSQETAKQISQSVTVIGQIHPDSASSTEEISPPGSPRFPYDSTGLPGADGGNAGYPHPAQTSNYRGLHPTRGDAAAFPYVYGGHHGVHPYSLPYYVGQPQYYYHPIWTVGATQMDYYGHGYLPPHYEF